MHVPDTIRESFVGQLIYHLSGRRYFRYAEDCPDFVLPDHYAKLIERPENRTSNSETRSNSDTLTLADPYAAEKAKGPKADNTKNGVEVTERQNSSNGSESETLEEPPRTQETMQLATAGAADPEKGTYAQAQERKLEEERRNPFIVDWYSPTDPENPRNVRHLLSSIQPLTDVSIFSGAFASDAS